MASDPSQRVLDQKNAARRVLVVDDEADIRELLRILLERAGFLVSEAADGAEGLRQLHAVAPAVVILDVTMGEADGWTTLASIRDVSNVPVIMLTARASEADRVRGLRGGADDYVVKPFGPDELVARVEALLRRAPEGSPQAEVFDDGFVSVDFARRIVTVAQRPIALSPLEFRLMAAFARSSGTVLTYEVLIRDVCRITVGVTPEQVHQRVSSLRRKLGHESAAAIETIRGVGYRYRPLSS